MFLDSCAYFLLRSETQGIITDYKELVHQRNTIPLSSCPSEIVNAIYSSYHVTETNKDEQR